jgi:LmbE family N-acetylglucosaminyl deacetylase
MEALDRGFHPSRVLAIGAHSDDIEIGCGGTISRLLGRDPTLALTWIVLTATEERAEEARRSASMLVGAAPNVEIRIEQFRERYFPFLPELKEYFDALGQSLDPGVIFSPWAGDAHQDHRTVSQLVRSTFRNQLCLEYEIPKSDGDFGRPSVYVELSAGDAERKIDLLMSCFPSQSVRQWFEPDTFRGLMRLRGMECRSTSGLAEAFFCQRLNLMGLE